MQQVKWLEWARQLQAISQNGLTFSNDPYDIERYKSIRSIAAQIMAQHSSINSGHIEKLFASEKGYATPKVDCRCFAVKDNKVLLVRERNESLWSLPGGWVDVGETPSEAVERECWEESGYIVQAAKLAAVYDRDTHGHPPMAQAIYKLFFVCEIIGGAPTQNEEVDAIEFFAEDSLPELSVSRVTTEEIARCYKHYRNPGLPTDFD